MIEQFWILSRKLRMILCEIDYWASVHGEEMFVTSLIRTHEEQARLFEAGATPYKVSVHESGRGADIRPFKDDNLNRLLIVWLDEKYPYDVKRPLIKTCLDERDGVGGSHFHIQVLT